MKTSQITIYPAVLLAAIILFAFFSSCSKNELVEPSTKTSETQMRIVNQKSVYPLSSVNGSGISGTVTFEKASRGTKVTIQLTGTNKSKKYPANIRVGSTSSATSGILVSLTPVNGSTGISSTIVTKSNFGWALPYEELITLDGHVKVHPSATQLNIAVSQGNIGINY